MKTVKRIIALVVLCSVVLLPVSAARGADGTGVPPEIQQKFLEDGGTVDYVDVTCMGPGYNGTYRHGRKKIQVQKGAPEDVPPHEYGHYIYHSTILRWDAEHRGYLAALHEFFKNDPRFSSENETFAVIYSWSCTGATGGEMREMVEYAEDLLLNTVK